MLYCPKEEEKAMKVIFLDIDGVLAHADYLNWQTRHIDPERVRFLAKIVELTDAQIVLTSTSAALPVPCLQWMSSWSKEMTDGICSRTSSGILSVMS